MKRLALIAVISGVIACTSTTPALRPLTEAADARLNRVLEEYFEEALELNLQDEDAHGRIAAVQYRHRYRKNVALRRA